MFVCTGRLGQTQPCHSSGSINTVWLVQGRFWWVLTEDRQKMVLVTKGSTYLCSHSFPEDEITAGLIEPSIWSSQALDLILWWPISMAQKLYVFLWKPILNFAQNAVRLSCIKVCPEHSGESRITFFAFVNQYYVSHRAAQLKLWTAVWICISSYTPACVLTGLAVKYVIVLHN